ncbi:hypothetical protein ACX3UL_09935 [Actinomyces urogenitalis]
MAAGLDDGAGALGGRLLRWGGGCGGDELLDDLSGVRVLLAPQDGGGQPGPVVVQPDEEAGDQQDAVLARAG